jgi:ribosomal protein S18 acetylase RimI-like enzyme
MMDDNVYIHLDATSSILPHLKAHLPHASTELYVVEIPPAPNSTVLATFPPTKSPPESSAWAVGVLGIVGMPDTETEFFFWSSVEVAPTINGDEDEEHFRTAYAQFEQMLRFISRTHPEKETLMVGALHSSIASHIPISSICDLSPWIKLAFSKDFLPPPSSYSQDIESKYIFQRMGMEDLDEVVQTSTVPRDKATLAQAPNTGAYLRSSEERRAQAWCFISREGDISTVYVRPEARGMGLGKETVRKELEKELVHRKFVVVHVSPTNTASLRLCQSLGSRRVFDIAWATILMNEYRDN